MSTPDSSEIRLKVELGTDKIPNRITWEATGTGEPEKECKAFMLSIWDAVDNNTLRIDLWTKDMRMDDMSNHFFQTLITLAETYERATHTTEVVSAMKKFCEEQSKKISAQMQGRHQQ